VIEVDHVTKYYGDKVAVDDLTFSVRPGIVTGFLGPNGAGKSTTMRLIPGLDAPSAGTATVKGRVYRELPAPLHEIGALLEGLAAEGRTVFLSSHVMSEIAQTAEHVVVIGRGRLIADMSVPAILAQASRGVGGAGPHPRRHAPARSAGR
jgi:ABC-2 type transport system ATP-binding protein